MHALNHERILKFKAWYEPLLWQLRFTHIKLTIGSGSRCLLPPIFYWQGLPQTWPFAAAFTK